MKYSVSRNPGSEALNSAGLMFELPSAGGGLGRGNGDGEFHLFAAGGKVCFPNWHWFFACGFRLLSDSAAQNRLSCWSNHLDHALGDANLELFTAVNRPWIRSCRWIRSTALRYSTSLNCGSLQPGDVYGVATQSTFSRRDYLP